MSVDVKTTRELIALLGRLGAAELEDEQNDQAQDDIQALLETIVAPGVADRIEYASYEADWYGLGLGLKTKQGLGVEESSMLLTEIISGLYALSDEELASLGAPLGLDFNGMRAALNAIFWFIDALEWQTRDAKIDAEYPPDVRERMLAARLRSLESFRRTGEP